MKKLFNIEKIKTLSYPSFISLIIIHFILFLIVTLVVSRIQFNAPGFSIKSLYQFPNVFKFIPWVASWFNIFLAIILILLIGNEFSYKTFKQSVIDGLNRNELVTGKLIVIFSIAIYTLLLVTITSLIYGFIYTKGANYSLIYENLNILIVYFIQAIAYMTLGMLFVIILKNNSLSIILFILYFFPIEPITRLFFPKNIRQYFPIEIISNLTPKPDIFNLQEQTNFHSSSGNNMIDIQGLGVNSDQLSLLTTSIVAIAYILLFIGISVFILRKRNL
ncbi:MAG: hypothetical protein PF487_02310 [Bacteroidales bacterium]|jgi:ABC-2 type transport system permease protein|nr:hypothetical protein [Bacteroidales bacterium]